MKSYQQFVKPEGADGMKLGANLRWALACMAFKAEIRREIPRVSVFVNYRRGITKEPTAGESRKVFVGFRWLQRVFPVEYMQALISGEPLEITTVKAYELAGINGGNYLPES